MKKLLYLFLALLLPGLIFVFLKYSGKNKFEIPVYHESGVENLPEGCEPSRERPYRFNTRAPFSNWRPGKANIIFFPGSELKLEIVKGTLLDEFGRDIMMEEAVKIDSAKIDEWKRCVFFVKDPYQSVLFDEGGRIRGYYDLRTREELDRLRVELKVLLEKY